MEAQRELQRRREFPPDENAADVRSHGAVAEICSVDPTKDKGRPRKHYIAIAQQEVEGRSHEGDRQINLLVRVFCPEKIAQEHLVSVRAEPRQIHRFAVNLDRLSGAGTKRADEFSLKLCQTRQLEAFVKK